MDEPATFWIMLPSYYPCACLCLLAAACGCLGLVCCDRACSKDEDGQQIFASDGDGRSLAEIEESAGTFFHLATERFDSRIAASGSQVEANWTFDRLQVIYLYIYNGAKSSGAAC